MGSSGWTWWCFFFSFFVSYCMASDLPESSGAGQFKGSWQCTKVSRLFFESCMGGTDEGPYTTGIRQVQEPHRIMVFVEQCIHSTYQKGGNHQSARFFCCHMPDVTNRGSVFEGGHSGGSSSSCIPAHLVHRHITGCIQSSEQRKHVFHLCVEFHLCNEL